MMTLHRACRRPCGWLQEMVCFPVFGACEGYPEPRRSTAFQQSSHRDCPQALIPQCVVVRLHGRPQFFRAVWTGRLRAWQPCTSLAMKYLVSTSPPVSFSAVLSVPSALKKGGNIGFV